MTQASGSDAVVFRVESLRKEYVMGEVTVHALRDVSLDVYEQEFLVVLGPSGSGKSTLLNIIGGIDSPTSGQVHFRREQLTGASEQRLTRYRRRHIGFIFQFYNLMPNLTARENVEMATEISTNPMPAMEALELVELEERSGHFPSQLSGGEQQRVAIARAVAKRPEILLCDEPTGALDFETGKIVLRVLKQINETLGTTTIIITHNAAIGGMARRVVRMMDGQIRSIEQNERRISADELEW
jgi:putative ABC transport system ATP-binding protein